MLVLFAHKRKYFLNLTTIVENKYQNKTVTNCFFQQWKQNKNISNGWRSNNKIRIKLRASQLDFLLTAYFQDNIQHLFIVLLKSQRFFCTRKTSKILQIKFTHLATSNTYALLLHFVCIIKDISVNNYLLSIYKKVYSISSGRDIILCNDNWNCCGHVVAHDSHHDWK